MDVGKSLRPTPIVINTVGLGAGLWWQNGGWNLLNNRSGGGS
jgi:hypothetical protein